MIFATFVYILCDHCGYFFAFLEDNLYDIPGLVRVIRTRVGNPDNLVFSATICAIWLFYNWMLQEVILKPEF